VILIITKQELQLTAHPTRYLYHKANKSAVGFNPKPMIRDFIMYPIIMYSKYWGAFKYSLLSNDALQDGNSRTTTLTLDDNNNNKPV
jgi:hypothetical protein